MDFGIARAGDSGMTEVGFHPRHGPVPGARAGPRPAGGRALRPVLGRHRPLRDAHRHGAVQGRQRRHRGAQARQRDGAGAGAAGPGHAVLAQPDRDEGDRQGPGPALPERRRSSPATCAPRSRAGRWPRRRSTPAPRRRGSWPPARPWGRPPAPPRRPSCRAGATRRSAARRGGAGPGSWPSSSCSWSSPAPPTASSAHGRRRGRRRSPSVVGKTQDEAVAALEEAGFKANVQEEFSDKYDKGVVSRQAPDGRHRTGRRRDRRPLGEQGARRPWPSRTSRAGRPQEVQDWLKQNQLSGVQKSGKSETVPDGQVFKQDPAGRHAGQAGRPDHLLGEQRQAAGHGARPERHDAGRRADGAHRRQAHARQRERPSRATDVASGQVIRQDPAAGTKVAKGTRREHRGLVGLAHAQRVAAPERARAPPA